MKKKKRRRRKDGKEHKSTKSIALIWKQKTSKTKILKQNNETIYYISLPLFAYVV